MTRQVEHNFGPAKTRDENGGSVDLFTVTAGHSRNYGAVEARWITPNRITAGLFFGGLCWRPFWILVGGTALFIRPLPLLDPSQPHPRLHGRTNGTLPAACPHRNGSYY